MHLNFYRLTALTLCLTFGFGIPKARAETPMAFSVEPMQTEMVLPAVSQSFTLRNLSSSSRKLRVEVLERRQDGEREINRKTSDLRVLENLLQLRPESATTIVVEYRGPKKLKSERAYRLVVTDESTGAGAMEALKLSYRASIFVRDQAHSPELVVRSWQPKGGARFEVVLKNQGRVRQALAGLAFEGLELTKESVKILESGMLLAGAERKLNLEVVDPGQIKALKQVLGQSSGATPGLIFQAPAAN